MMEPHFSATILITLTTLLMMYVGGAKIRHFIILAIPAFIGGVAMIFAEPYRLQRLLSFGDPFADKQRSRLADCSVSLCHWFRRCVRR